MSKMPTDPDCIFCKIVAGSVPSFRLYEDAATLAFMDIHPLNEGHCLVIHKGHYPDLYSMPAQALKDVTAAAHRVATAVRDALQPAGLNLVQANGPGAAQSVPHFHIHVLPRRPDDDARLNWELKAGDMGRIGQTAERIRARLG